MPRNKLYTKKADTLTIAERMNIRTNTLGWLLLSPNIGAEMTIGSHNWNRITVGFTGRMMRTTSQEENPYIRRFINEGRVEGRYYWHGKGLKRSWFAGLYGGYADYDLKLSEERFQGKGPIAGLTAGTIAPLYGYRNGSSIDLEMSFNAGAIWNNGQMEWNPLPYVAVCDAIRVSLVWHMGPSVADRYYKRITIDDDFRSLQNELSLQRDSIERVREQQKKMKRDSLEEVDYERRFEKQRKELEEKHLRDSLRQVKERGTHEK